MRPVPYTSRHQVALASKPLEGVLPAPELLPPAPSGWRGDRAAAYPSRLSAPLAPEPWQRTPFPEDAPAPVPVLPADGDLF